MSVIVTVFWNKVNTTFGLLVPVFPWEHDPTGHFVLVYFVTVVIYLNFTWLVVDQCGKSNPVFTFAKIIKYVLECLS